MQPAKLQACFALSVTPHDSLVVDGLAIGQTSHTNLMQQLRHVREPIVEIRLHMWACTSDSADCIADFAHAHKKIGKILVRWCLGPVLSAHLNITPRLPCDHIKVWATLL